MGSKDAYYYIPTDEHYLKCLKFQWRSKLYKLTECPIGLCISPRIFTKTNMFHIETSRSKSVVYIDHTYLQVETKDPCCNNVKAILTNSKYLTNLLFLTNYMRLASDTLP